MRRACREHALAAGRASRREHLRAPARVVVKPEDHPDPLPSREVFERVLEVAAGQQLDSRRRARAAARGCRAACTLVTSGLRTKPDGIEHETHPGVGTVIGRDHPALQSAFTLLTSAVPTEYPPPNVTSTAVSPTARALAKR